MILLPILASLAKLSEPLIGYNVIKELVENPEEYGMSQEDLIGHLEHSIPSVENVKAVVNLIQEKTNADLCKVRTTKRAVVLGPKESRILRCHIPTGNLDKQRTESLVVFA